MLDMLLESGKITQRVAFYLPGQPNLVATGGGFTVTKQKNTTTASAYTTPDIVEDSFKPGLYRLLVDESTTITSGETFESILLIVEHAYLAVPVQIRICLYDALRVDVRKVLGTAVIVGGAAPASPIGY